MSSPLIRIKRSAVAGKVPHYPSQIDLGEFAINTADGKVFIAAGTEGVGVGTTVIEVGISTENLLTGIVTSTTINTTNLTVTNQISGISSGATKVETATDAGNQWHHVGFLDHRTGYQKLKTNGLTYNPSTGKLYAGIGSFGTITGNLTGDVTGNLTGNVTGNVSGNVTGEVTADQLSVTGIATIGNNVVVGGATTDLIVRGDARVTGVLTVGNSSLTFNGENDTVQVGTALTLGHTQGIQFYTQSLHATGFEVNNINASGIITATNFVGDGSGLTNINVTGVNTFSGNYNHLYNKPTIPTNNNQLTNGAGFITDYTVTQSDVTAHQSALSITESQISDFGTYATAASVAGIDTSGFIGAGSTFSGNYNHLYNKPTIPTNNNQLTNGAGYITGYTVTQSDVTAHQSALSITESQISDLGTYLTSSDLSSYATTSYVDTEVAGLVDSAPVTLNTLNELAAALGDDANFSTTVTNSIAGKLPLSGGQMTGNITMSGAQTVDGRDLSVDGAKLDGIESGATADQTASEILTAIKTVDGSGSGLDADTVDGIQASSFLRSDANDSASGEISLTSTTVPLTLNAIRFNNTENDSSYYTDGDGTLAFDQNFSADTEYGTDTYSPNSVFTGGDGGGLLIKNQDGWGAVFTSQNTRWATAEWDGLTVDGNRVLTVADEGTGNGLDADTVDGIQASSFLRSDANDTTTGNLTIQGAKVILDDTSTSIGPWEVYQASTGQLTFTVGGTSGPEMELTTDGSNYLNTTLTVANSRVLTVADEGTGNGLDADTVDGIQGASFMRSDANTSATLIDFGNCRITADGHRAGLLAVYNDTGTWGGLQIRNGSWEYALMGDSSGHVGIYNDNNNEWMIYCTANGSVQLRHDGTTCIETTGTSSATIDGNTIWHAGNDGSGSGLDADTVDGIQAASFLRSDADDSFSGALTGSGTISVTGTKIECGRTSGSVAMTTNDGYGNANLCFNHTSGVPDVSGSSCRIETSVDNNTANMYFELKDSVTANSATTLTETLRLTTSAITFKGDTVWHAGNDGSGSGLDADTVDGIQGASLLRSDANDTLSAIITGHASDTEVLRVRSSSYSSNYLYIGGWSSANSNNISRIRTSSNLHIDSPANGNLYFNWYASNRTIHIGNTGQVVLAAGSNTVWHAGNDGSGSGLDADTVDGIQGSALAPIASPTFTGNLTIPNSIVHTGDSDTYIQFHGNNLFRVVIAGAEVQEWGGNYTLLSDNDTLRLGSGSDFRMWFNGADTFFRNYAHANGDIIFQGETSGGTNQNILIMKTDSTRTYNVLYENSQERFRTTSAGVTVTGALTATGNVTAYSDVRLKTNIEVIPDALDKVSKIRGVTFDRIDNGLKQTGVIAQEVEKVLPEVVTTGQNDMKSVAYGNMNGLLIEAIKELTTKLNTIEERLDRLEGKE